MNLFLYILLFFYISIGTIIGLKISELFKKWYKKLLIIVVLSIWWLPMLPADIIANNVIINYYKSKRGEK